MLFMDIFRYLPSWVPELVQPITEMNPFKTKRRETIGVDDILEKRAAVNGGIDLDSPEYDEMRDAVAQGVESYLRRRYEHSLFVADFGDEDPHNLIIHTPNNICVHYTQEGGTGKTYIDLSQSAVLPLDIIILKQALEGSVEGICDAYIKNFEAEYGADD
jgi:hypothetical protein